MNVILTLKPIKNANLTFKVTKLGTREFAIAIPSKGTKTWTLSQTIALGPMLREEIAREKMGFKGFLFSGLSYCFQAFGKLFQINEAIYPSHFGFSTTIYNKGDIARVLKNTQSLKEQYPKHAIIIRSINSMNFRGRENKFRLIPSRVIFVMNDVEEQWYSRTDTKADLKIFEENDIELKNYAHSIPDDVLARCKELYDDLYLQKYSLHNPDYSIEYLRDLIESDVLRFHVIHARSGKVLAFCATQKSDNVLACPILGYDKNSSIPLYRAIMCVAPMIAMKAKLTLNHSAGAPIFKKNRGAIAMMEYILVIDDHLPSWRRFGYSIIAKVLRSFENEILKAANK